MEEGKQLPKIEDHTLYGKFMADLKEKPDSYFIQINEKYKTKSYNIMVDMNDYFRKRGAIYEKKEETNDTNGNGDKWKIPIIEDFSPEGNLLFEMIVKFDELVANPVDKTTSTEAVVITHLGKMFAASKKIDEILKKSDSELIGYGYTAEDISALRSFSKRIQDVIKEKFKEVFYTDIDKTPEEILREKLGKTALEER